MIVFKKRKVRRHTALYDWHCRKLLPLIAQARALGYRRLDDLLPVVNAQWAKHPKNPLARLLTRSCLYRALRRLRELGLDAGPDTLSQARTHGRPTRGANKAAQTATPPLTSGAL